MFACNHNATQHRTMSLHYKCLIINQWKLNLVLLYSCSQTSGIHGERETHLLNGQWSYQHVRFNHQEHRLRGWVHPWGRHQDLLEDYTTHSPQHFLLPTLTLLIPGKMFLSCRILGAYTNIQRVLSSITLFDLSFPYLCTNTKTHPGPIFIWMHKDD